MAKKPRRQPRDRDRERFLADLDRQRRAKGLLSEPEKSPGEDSQEDGQPVGDVEDVLPTSAIRKDGQVFCPAGAHYTSAEEMRGAICYYHKRHPEPLPADRRPGVVFPEGFWGRP
jgi:hypothetical protein